MPLKSEIRIKIYCQHGRDIRLDWVPSVGLYVGEALVQVLILKLKLIFCKRGDDQLGH